MTTHNHERHNYSGNLIDSRRFSLLITDLGLLDTPISGSLFTWTNNQNPPALVKLDHILVNSTMAMAFPEFFDFVRDRKLSDHNPLLFKMAPHKRKSTTHFRIENTWLQYDQFIDIIKAGLCNPLSSSPSSESPLKHWLILWKSLRRVILEWDKRRHNLISSLNVAGSSISDWTQVASAFKTFYVDLLGRIVTPLLRLRWTSLYQNSNSILNSLDDIFSLTEVHELLANRLAPLIHDLIDNKQGAFIGGRSTLDCFMTSYETIWGCKRWISWIYRLLSTAESSLLINGSEGRSFKHRRGVRQGNTLSPLLFNLVTDTLLRLISRAADLGLVIGALSLTLQESITHILFVDDLLLFCKADEESMRSLRLILNCFELCSCLKINPLKTKAIHVLGDATKAAQATEIFGCSVGTFPIQAGRLTLVNSVITSQASYFFSIFMAPHWVYKHIDRRRRTFFWIGKGDDSSQGKCLMSWDSMTCRQTEGGLGILDLPSHNRARLANWIWKLFQPTGMPRQDILTGLYPRLLELHTEDKPHLSHIWRHISSLLEALQPSFTFSVGDGSNLRLWHTPCFNDHSLRERYPSLFSGIISTYISFSDAKLRDSSGAVQGWNLRFRYLVPIYLLNNLVLDLAPHLNSTGVVSISWIWNTNVVYSTNRFYRILNFRGVGEVKAPYIWQKECPPACSMHTWLVERHQLLTKDKLITWNRPNSVLHIAAKQGKTDFAKLTSPQTTTVAPRTYSRTNVKTLPNLHCAARVGHVDMVSVFISWARLHNKIIALIETTNDIGNTALHEAVQNGHYLVVAALLDKISSLSAVKNNINGVSPLYMAVL
ncbi:hypothetical protein Cni_G22096 [Canna indica]|uniref:Reverse transcriptase domain-containing protein n=1 Tax=Canna indica TaxID=4628 RepID=A0AAQ3QHY3_9LILI|nr:hypothetical protein Cni_G22096 [Canna indica]